VINYFPLSKTAKEKRETDNEQFIQSVVQKKLGTFVSIKWLKGVAVKYVKKKLGPVYNEKDIPGRMYTFLAVKE
jgi:hypothetical protein